MEQNKRNSTLYPAILGVGKEENEILLTTITVV